MTGPRGNFSEGRPAFFDKHGNRLNDVHEWARLFDQPNYQRVGSTMIQHRWWVSTAWIGLDMGHGFSLTPITFETCVFDTGTTIMLSTGSTTCESAIADRYATLEQAEQGHAAVVAFLNDHLDLLQIVDIRTVISGWDIYDEVVPDDSQWAPSDEPAAITPRPTPPGNRHE